MTDKAAGPDAPTPRTDAEEQAFRRSNSGVAFLAPCLVSSDFARQLERELAALTEQLAERIPEAAVVAMQERQRAELAQARFRQEEITAARDETIEGLTRQLAEARAAQMFERTKERCKAACEARIDKARAVRLGVWTVMEQEAMACSKAIDALQPEPEQDKEKEK